MCKLDDILATAKRPFVKPVPQKRGLSYEHIMFNTDLLFLFSKRIGIPIDKALQMVSTGKGKVAYRSAYRRRGIKTQKQMVDELCKIVEGA